MRPATQPKMMALPDDVFSMQWGKLNGWSFQVDACANGEWEWCATFAGENEFGHERDLEDAVMSAQAFADNGGAR